MPAKSDSDVVPVVFQPLPDSDNDGADGLSTTSPDMPPGIFAATLHLVHGRGRAPLEFLYRLLDWGKKAPMDLFIPNFRSADAYAVIRSSLGTFHGQDASGTPVYKWDSLLHRKAAMLELVRVCAGLESKWTWNESEIKDFVKAARASWPVMISNLGDEVFEALNRDSALEFMRLLK